MRKLSTIHSQSSRSPFGVRCSLFSVGCSNSSCRQSAFTLIEVLLVLVILGVMVTVMLPQVMSSLREHELRGATRIVMSAGRHAMSLAVLSQRQMSVVVDLDASTLTIRAAPRSKRLDGTGEEQEGGEPEPTDPLAAAVAGAWEVDAGETEPDDTDGAYEGAVAIVDEEVVHRFNSIRFSFIEIRGEDGYRAEEGQHTIVYYTNGRCTPHTVGIEDNDGATATIDIDALCSARVLKD